MRFLRACYLANFAVLACAAFLVASAPGLAATTDTVAIQETLNHPSAPLSSYRLDLNAIRRFYAARNYLPVWSGATTANRDAALAVGTLKRADEDGLDPTDYRLDAIQARQALSSGPAQAEFDVLLTASVLSYMRDLRIGRILPSQTGDDIALPAMEFDTVMALSDTLARGAMQNLTADTAPPHMEYAQLKMALARYRAIAIKGGWPLIPGKATGKLTLDDSRLALLRARLAAEDASLGAKGPEDVVGELIEALKRFQARSGLEETGGLGKQTLAALNVPVEQRISQIIANMERWRWLPRSFEETYIEANAAATMLKVVDRGKVALTSRIITGKAATPTPIFVATITAVTVNPYWNIPNSIAKKEILPKEQRRPGYMASEGIGFDGPDGALRQQPGPKNALGLVKLEMPNRFNSYLHDTPSRSLFSRDERHLSHGCMRVEQILPLASWVMTGDANAALDKIGAAIAAGDNKKFTLDRPLPVYVLYWTVIADQAGQAEFRPDVYGRDKKLLAALAGRRPTVKTAANLNCQAVKAG